MKNAVELKNVSFKYKEDAEWVLQNFSLTIKEGQWVTILGHNGSGKSTVSKIMAGLSEINSGSVKIFDKEYNKDNIYDIRQEISVLFQNADSQFVGATVEDDIAFNLENHFFPVGEMKSIILKVLDKVKMSKYINAAPHNLSGGQKQKVSIAGILAISPKIIIFDESTSMLDPQSVKDINNIIKEIHIKHNITVINITHNMEETLLSKRLVIIEKGQIVFDGALKEILFDEVRLKSLKLDAPFVAKISNEMFKQGLANFKTLSKERILSCLK